MSVSRAPMERLMAYQTTRRDQGVEDDCHVGEASHDGDLGDVGDPELVGPVGDDVCKRSVKGVLLTCG